MKALKQIIFLLAFFCISPILTLHVITVPQNNDVTQERSIKHQKEDAIKFKLDPPDHKSYVAMARYVMHQAEWVSFGTISTIPNIKSFPFTTVVSMSDGTVDNSTGVPYFYLTPLDFSTKDIQKDPRCTISASLEQTSFCKDMHYDPNDPRCARVMLSGVIVKMDNTTDEYKFAKDALFSRHPAFPPLPLDHGFYVAKLNVKQVVMLDWFGGPIFIKLDDYYSFKFNNTEKSTKTITKQ